MRATMHGLLTTEATLTAIVPAGQWYQAGNVIDQPAKPFVVERWISPVILGPGLLAYQLRLDVHDERGSYARIGAFLVAAKAFLESVQQVTGPDGWITQCDFSSEGGDQESDEYGTDYSWTGWQVIGGRSG